MIAACGFSQDYVEIEANDTINGSGIVFQELDIKLKDNNVYGYAGYVDNIGLNSNDTVYVSLFGSNDQVVWAKLTTADSIIIAPSTGVAVVHLISGTTTPFLYYKRRFNSISTDTVVVRNDWVLK